MAIPKDSGHCMYAEAIRAALPDAGNISVDLATIRWTDKKLGLRYIYLTPQEVQQSLLGFDQGFKPEPFPFALKRAAQIVRSRGGEINAARKRRAESRQIIVRKSEQKNVQETIAPESEQKNVQETTGANPDHKNDQEKAWAEFNVPGFGRVPRFETTSASIIPTVVGGSPPPLFRNGRRREFGLKVLVR